MRKFGLFSIFIITLAFPMRGGAVEPTDKELREKVRFFLERLASPECVIRQQAVLEEWVMLRSSIRDFTNFIAILEEELEVTAKEAKPRGRLILKSLKKEQEFNGGQGLEAWIQKWLGATMGVPTRDKPGAFRRAKKELLRIAKDRTADLLARTMAISFMASIVDQYEDPWGKAEQWGVPAREWKKELIALLDDPDPDLAMIVAISIAGLEAFSKVDRSKLVPKLIKGLRHEDFDTRWGAQVKLQKLTGQVFCIDPTDPLPAREPGIRKWEEWWASAKTKPKAGRP